MRRPLALLLALPLAVAACSPAGPPAVDTTPTVGVQLFQWPWRSVAKECTDVLGPHGVGFVLLSPAQEHIEGDQWWTSYQPVSYQLESKLGTREEFAQMVEACGDAGVDVIADAVINHMAGIDGGVGVAGTEFEHYEYPGLYGRDDFHTCSLTVSGDIENYLDQQQVQECELVNLADLDTGSDTVRDTIAAYLDDLTSLGVDGFRIDAAKHMSAGDVEAIVGRLQGDPRIISEVIRGSGEPIQPEDYLDAGAVFAFQVAKDLAGIVPGGSVHRAVELRDGEVPSDDAYTFVTNHDTERNGQTLSSKDPDEFRVATALLIGIDYGTPVLYSGYAFSDRDAGPPSGDGRVHDVECAQPAEDPADGAWLCQHRDVLGLAEWAAVVGDAPVANMWREGYAVGWDRGELGLIAVNDSSRPATVRVSTGLPDGEYCDAAGPVAPPTTRDRCAEGGVVVEDGAAELQLPAMGAVALHVNLRAG